MLFGHTILLKDRSAAARVTYKKLARIYPYATYFHAGHLFMSDESVLFVKERAGNWGPPKGRAEAAETHPLQTADREVSEELGFYPASEIVAMIVVERPDLGNPAVLVYFVNMVEEKITAQPMKRTWRRADVPVEVEKIDHEIVGTRWYRFVDLTYLRDISVTTKILLNTFFMYLRCE